MQIRKTNIKVTRGDITKLNVNALVIPAQEQLALEGELGERIKRRGGKEIEQQVREKAPVRVGEVTWSSAGKLPADYLIHSVIVNDDRQTGEAILRHGCANALACADHLQVESLGFPALGCETGEFPVVGAAKILSQEIIKYLRREESGIREIIFCLQDPDLFCTFEQTISGYITHIQDRLGEGPYATVDIIIELPKGIVLIERSNPPYGWALPGGFVDYGESLETAARREAKEETNLELMNLRQFHTYSHPDRDPRFHTISTVFIAEGNGKPRSGDDAKDLAVLSYENILGKKFAFDHKDILQDYLNTAHRGKTRKTSL